MFYYFFFQLLRLIVLIVIEFYTWYCSLPVSVGHLIIMWINVAFHMKCDTVWLIKRNEMFQSISILCDMWPIEVFSHVLEMQIFLWMSYYSLVSILPRFRAYKFDSLFNLSQLTFWIVVPCAFFAMFYLDMGL